MIKFRLKYGIEIWVDSDDPNLAALIQHSIPYPELADYAETLLRTLSSQHGAFGHLIGNTTTPIDLHAAMNKPEMAEYRPQLIEGAEMVQIYVSGIPDGAKS